MFVKELKNSLLTFDVGRHALEICGKSGHLLLLCIIISIIPEVIRVNLTNGFERKITRLCEEDDFIQH